MIVNFHIGAPRIGAELVSAVASAESLSKNTELLVMPKEIYREYFRSLVNSKDPIRSKENYWNAAEEKIQSLTKYDTVAISQHAALGEHHDLIFSKRGIELAAGRVAKLSSLFDSHPLRFFFTITSQVEYFIWTLGIDARSAIAAGATISWTDIIGRLKAVTPDRQFVVWDFERPQKVALAFVAQVLDTYDRDFLTDARQLISCNNAYISFKNMKNSLEGLEDSLARLDDQYGSDLEAISKMDGVTVIRSDEVPNEFHLST
jgi:hypothetical protein